MGQFVVQFFGTLLALGAGLGVWAIKEWAQRVRTRTVVTKALLTELRNLCIAFRQRHRWWTCGVEPADDWAPPLIDFSTKVYDSHVGRLGELEDDVAAKLVVFHGFVAFINELHAERAEYLAQGLGQDFYDQYHHTLDTHVRLRGLEHYDDLFRRYELDGAAATSLPPVLDHTVAADVLESCRVTDAAAPPEAPPAPATPMAPTRSQKLRKAATAKISKPAGKGGKAAGRGKKKA